MGGTTISTAQFYLADFGNFERVATKILLNTMQSIIVDPVHVLYQSKLIDRCYQNCLQCTNKRWKKQLVLRGCVFTLYIYNYVQRTNGVSMRQLFFWGVGNHATGYKHFFNIGVFADAIKEVKVQGCLLLHSICSLTSIISGRCEKIASPSVVAITTEVATQNPFSWMASGTSSSEGSGVVIDTQGIILTNAHVVEVRSRLRLHSVMIEP